MNSQANVITIDVIQFSQLLSEVLAQKRSVGVSRNPNYALYSFLQKNFDEAELQKLALEFGMEQQELKEKSYESKILATSIYVLQPGQLIRFIEWGKSRTPLVNWDDIPQENNDEWFHRQEFISYPSYLQLGLLLLEFFSIGEVRRMAARIDETYDWEVYPYLTKSHEIIAVFITYAIHKNFLKNVLEQMKAARPHVSVIQQFYLRQETYITPTIQNPEDLFKLAKFQTVPQYQTYHLLYKLLIEHFSLIDLYEICQDASLDNEQFPGNSIEKVANQITLFVERSTEMSKDEPGFLNQMPIFKPSNPKRDVKSNYYLKRFITACSHRVPDVNWAEAVQINNALPIPPYDSLSKDGFKIPIIRQLLLACWSNNDDLLNFVESQMPYIRPSLSIDFSFRQNVLRVINSQSRRGRLQDFLNILQKIYPKQYKKLAPYTVQKTV